MDDDQQFCLRWNNHQSTLISVFDTLLENGTLVDCTLAAEGKFLKAHKVVLSACSPYFATLLSQQYDKHPIFILKDVKFQELRAMMDYMYRGEVNISQDQLAALLKAAESLQIKGLSDSRGTSSTSSSSHNKDHLQKAKMDGRNITITEQKRQKLGGHHAPTTVDHSIEMTSREGSASPTSRKRKKTRRRSTEAATNAAAIAAAAAAANNLSDHHDQHSNSSFHSLSAVGGASAAATAASLVSSSATTSAQQQQTIGSSTSIVTGALVGGVVGSGQTTHITTSSAILLQPATTSTTTTSSSSSTSANVTKKTEQLIHDTKLETEIDDEEEQDHHHQMKIQQQQQQQQHHDHSDDGDDDDDDDEDSEPEQLLQQQRKRPRRHVGGVDNGKSKMDTDMMIEPKSEYEDGQDEPVEDLTLDDEELMEDLDQAGPSHGGGGAGGTSGAGGEGSSQGYAAWQVDRPQDEVFLNAQETGGQHRDTQGVNLKRETIGSSIHQHSQPPPLQPPPTDILMLTQQLVKHQQEQLRHRRPSSSDDTKKYLHGHDFKQRRNILVDNYDDDDDIDDNDEDHDDDDDEEDRDGRQGGVGRRGSGGANSRGSGGVSGLMGRGGMRGGDGGDEGGDGATSGCDDDSSDDQPCDLRLFTPDTCLRELSVGQQAALNQLASSGGGGGGGGVGGIGGGVAVPTAHAPYLPKNVVSTIAATSMLFKTEPNLGPMPPGGMFSPSSGGSGGGGGTGGGGSGGLYMCKRCGNSYARPHSLNRHLRFECGVEPKFECPICHKKSKHKHNLVLHMRTHQNR